MQLGAQGVWGALGKGWQYGMVEWFLGVSPCPLAKNLDPSWSVRVTGMGNILADGFVTGRTSEAKSAMVLIDQPGEKSPLPGGDSSQGFGELEHLIGGVSVHIYTFREHPLIVPKTFPPAHPEFSQPH